MRRINLRAGWYNYWRSDRNSRSGISWGNLPSRAEQCRKIRNTPTWWPWAWQVDLKYSVASSCVEGPHVELKQGWTFLELQTDVRSEGADSLLTQASIQACETNTFSAAILWILGRIWRTYRGNRRSTRMNKNDDHKKESGDMRKLKHGGNLSKELTK